MKTPFLHIIETLATADRADRAAAAIVHGDAIVYGDATSRQFLNAKEAQSFEIELRARGVKYWVLANNATPPEIQMRPDSAATEQMLANGDETARAALKWALESYWAKEGHTLASIIFYLEADLYEGKSNGESSARAAILLDRLLSALSSNPQVECVVAPARPARWEILWVEPKKLLSDD